MPSGCPLKKDRYETPLLCALVHSNGASVLFCTTLSESMKCNKAMYGFSKPSCITCGFCCDVSGERLSRQKRVKHNGGFFPSLGCSCLTSAAIAL